MPDGVLVIEDIPCDENADKQKGRIVAELHVALRFRCVEKQRNDSADID